MANRAVKWAWKQELDPAAKAVLVAICDMASKALTCYPGMKLLATMTGYSEKTVERAVDRLEAAGLIGRERRNGRGGYRTSNLYRVLMPNSHGDGQAKPSESRIGDGSLTDSVSDLTDSVSPPNRHSDGAEENPQIEPPEENRVPDRPVTLGTRFAEPLCAVLIAAMKANGVKTPATISKAWLDAARLLVDVDKRDPHEAKAVLEWATSDSFWRSNILSMPTFREKYDRLRLNRERELPAAAPDPFAGMREFR